jgi:hypothetical protein
MLSFNMFGPLVPIERPMSGLLFGRGWRPSVSCASPVPCDGVEHHYSLRRFMAVVAGVLARDGLLSLPNSAGRMKQARP